MLPVLLRKTYPVNPIQSDVILNTTSNKTAQNTVIKGVI